MNDGRIRVLYIAGVGRSGSTVLNNLLGEIEGFFSAGEFSYIWNRGFAKNRLCSCGAPFAECEVWGEVAERAFGGLGGVDGPWMDRLQKGSTRLRQLPLMLAPQGRRMLESRWGPFRENLAKIYGAITAVTGSRVIVDGSKLPLYGYMLHTMPQVDPYVVHLTRDPRAVAYSWLRQKPKPVVGGLAHMPQRHPASSATEWNVGNRAARTLLGRPAARYLPLRYEDFVERPLESVRRVLDLVGEGDAPLPFISGRRVEFGVNHNVGGNPTRFRTGAVELRPDREWTLKMRPRDRRTVTALTAPFLRDYGYPLSLGGREE